LPNDIAERIDAAAVAGHLRVAMMRMVRRIKRETGGDTPSAISALGAVHRLGSPTLGEFAEAEGISKPSASAQAAALLRRGLLAREGSPDDGRLVHLSVTPLGERAIARSRTERTAWLARRLGRLKPEELATLEAAAHLLDRLLEAEP
jgi:DNA-binding MarR family transcriptional regulator